MRPLKWLSQVIVPAVGLVAIGHSAATAQQPKTFKARLAPVPIDIAMQATVAGGGTVTAVLTGARLAITGTFDGLRSPATVAQVHKGPVKGVRGPVVFDLTVAKAADPLGGTISGAFNLTPLQVADLEKGRLYVQLHSEKAPDGNLWGWLLIQENRR
jgi:hypothetical protein